MCIRDRAIPFPIASSTGETQGTWVWFDALPNYLTATGYPDGPWRDRWPADLHVIGKDINRLHTIVWPAMLQAAQLPIPRRCLLYTSDAADERSSVDLGG